MSDKKESIRSPLGHARGLGSAKDGTHHWWMQRVTAIALVPLSIYFLITLRGVMSVDRAALWRFIGHPLNAIPSLMFIVASFYHAMLGIQVIIEDYVHDEGCKIFCLMLNKLSFLCMGFACCFAILYISFGNAQ